VDRRQAILWKMVSVVTRRWKLQYDGLDADGGALDLERNRFASQAGATGIDFGATGVRQCRSSY